ncbi:hypothetical protein A2U01_0078001, partial [Trifolium medium]|nr:hypothetical protein [Trifolium medium]
MADFASELVKILADQKAPKRGKKKLSGRTSVVLDQTMLAGSSSPGGVSSSQGGSNVGSPVGVQPPPKRQREADPINDVEQFEKPFLLPRV